MQNKKESLKYIGRIKGNDFLHIQKALTYKTGGRLSELLFLCVCVITAIIMVFRVFFGTEFTDEAFTVSDALAIMHGNIPYTYNTVIVAGQAFIPILFYKPFELLVPSMTGIFLYSRLTYTMFRFCIIYYIYRTISERIERKWGLLLSCVLIVYGGGIPNWGYNQTSMYLMLFNIFFLKKVIDSNDSVRKSFRLGLGGWISSIAVFTHQGCIVAVATFLLIIIFCSKKTYRFWNAFAYCIGGIINILMILTPIIIYSGFDKFIYGVNSMTLGPPNNYFKSTLSERAIDVIALGNKWWIGLTFLSIILFCLLRRYIQIGKSKLTDKEYWLLSVSCSIIVSFIVSCYKAPDISIIVGVVCVGAFILLIPTYEGLGDLACYFGVYNILFIILLTINSLTGNRYYYCIPMIIPVLIELFKKKNRLFHEIAVIIAVLLIVMLGTYSFKNIYRDEQFSKLTSRVSDGVYKGIYTTPDRAHDVVELEKYINDNISLDEAVSFRDNVPVAYLMRNKNICDVRTWDIMQYSYECNDPTLMYRYYKNKQEIPDVIAYIDFGRDEIMSIEKSQNAFQFNKFVNRYYKLEKNDFENNTFKVMIYRNKGEFDGEYDELINTIEK